ncbi:MAG TPA: hypothetical protein VEV16_04810 [Daejeonella sp.]|nr:hypothetical protein [Daejeonella sp.]
MANLNSKIHLKRVQEDEIHARIADRNLRPHEVVNAIKTGSTKQKSTFDKPFDEQMYTSFDEMREQS